MMGINEMTTKVHNLALEAGWWLAHEESKPTLSPEAALSKHMLFVTEVAEASEEVRNKKPEYYWNTPTGMVTHNEAGGSFNLWSGDILLKPEGELSEIADVMIRLMDYAGFKGWDLEKAIIAKHDFNKTRAFRHGNKAL